MTARERALSIMHAETAFTVFRRADRERRALYICRASAADIARLSEEGWTTEQCGAICRISPGIKQLETLRRELNVSPDRFSGLPCDPEITRLLTALLNYAELPDGGGDIDRIYRQTVAAALRRHAGGGLEICRAIYKEELI